MTVSENTAALGLPVEVEDIEKELRQLWEVDEARTNASLMNFAVYSEREGSLESNSDIVRELTREHACRAILIGLDRHEEEKSIRAWITAHCHLAHGQKSVCCEQIAFHLTGRSTGRFRNTIFSNLSSDLPLILWWQGDLSERFSEGLYRRVNRLVIDSSDWANVGEGFDRMINAWNTSNSLVIQDLAWTRTYHYRHAVASLYDDAEAFQALPDTERINVTANPKHHHSALLMVAWFCDLAGWTCSNAEDCDASLNFRFSKPNGGLVDVVIELDENSAPVGKFEVLAGSTEVSVSRSKTDVHLHHVLKSDHHTIDTHGQSDSDDNAELLTDQLSRGGKNSLYKRVFPKFMELL